MRKKQKQRYKENATTQNEARTTDNANYRFELRARLRLLGPRLRLVFKSAQANKAPLAQTKASPGLFKRQDQGFAWSVSHADKASLVMYI